MYHCSWKCLELWSHMADRVDKAYAAQQLQLDRYSPAHLAQAAMPVVAVEVQDMLDEVGTQ